MVGENHDLGKRVNLYILGKGEKGRLRESQKVAHPGGKKPPEIPRLVPARGPRRQEGRRSKVVSGTEPRKLSGHTVRAVAFLRKGKGNSKEPPSKLNREGAGQRTPEKNLSAGGCVKKVSLRKARERGGEKKSSKEVKNFG